MSIQGELNLGSLCASGLARDAATARVAQQFDVVIHIDETSALDPLETWARHGIDLPETYPTGV
jgi:hypothetical protein